MNIKSALYYLVCLLFTQNIFAQVTNNPSHDINIAFEKGDYAAVIEQYTTILAVGKTPPYPLHIQRAIAFWQMGNIEAAYQDLATAMLIEPQKPDAYLYKARFFD